jgi:hypothetical protein
MNFVVEFDRQAKAAGIGYRLKKKGIQGQITTLQFLTAEGWGVVMYGMLPDAAGNVHLDSPPVVSIQGTSNSGNVISHGPHEGTLPEFELGLFVTNPAKAAKRAVKQLTAWEGLWKLSNESPPDPPRRNISKHVAVITILLTIVASTTLIVKYRKQLVKAFRRQRDKLKAMLEELKANGLRPGRKPTHQQKKIIIKTVKSLDPQTQNDIIRMWKNKP